MIILPGKDHDSSPPADHHHGFPLIPPKTYAFWLSDFAIFLNAAQVPLKNFAKFLHAAVKFHKSLGPSLKGFGRVCCYLQNMNYGKSLLIARRSMFFASYMLTSRTNFLRNSQGLCPRYAHPIGIAPDGAQGTSPLTHSSPPPQRVRREKHLLFSYIKAFSVSLLQGLPYGVSLRLPLDFAPAPIGKIW